MLKKKAIDDATLWEALQRIAHERSPEAIDEAEWLRAIARDAIRKTKSPKIPDTFFLSE